MNPQPAAATPVIVTIGKAWPAPGGRCACTGWDVDGERHRFIMPARLGSPQAGEVWEFSGEMVDTPFGAQMNAEGASYRQPDGRLLIGFLSRHEAFRTARIGKARAAAMWEAFGDRLYEILDRANAEELATVDRLPPDSIPLLLAAWKGVKAHGAVVRWLAAKGFPARVAHKIVEVYGAKAVEKLEDNPYRLLAFCPFAQCEEAANAMGIAVEDPRRLAAAAQEAAYRELADGHTVSPREVLVSRLRELVHSRTLANKALQYGLTTRALIEIDEGISAMGIWALESDAMRLLDGFLAPNGEGAFDLPLTSRRKVEAAIHTFERETGYPLSDAQRDAVFAAFENRVSVLCGGAGTGKTTVLRAICRAQAEGIYLMALTGQASRRMTEATGKKATTIEYFLRRIITETPGVPGAFIIVDEASMLDLVTTVRLLRALHRSCRLLLLGDPAQLPPVGFGLVFHRLASERTIPRVELTVVKRQSSQSGIPEVSSCVRDGVVPLLPSSHDSSADVCFDVCPRTAVLDRLFKHTRTTPDAIILCPRNGGGLGVDDINLFFHLRLSNESAALPGSVISAGEPVIFKKNIPGLDLVNGSVGTAIATHESEDGLVVNCEFDGREVAISGPNLEWLKLAYAVTVHSAQGSQFPHVLIVSEQSRVVDRTWIYTAITRAIRRVIIIGDDVAFARAVIAPPTASSRRVAFKAPVHNHGR